MPWSPYGTPSTLHHKALSVVRPHNHSETGTSLENTSPWKCRDNELFMIAPFWMLLFSNTSPSPSCVGPYHHHKSFTKAIVCFSWPIGSGSAVRRVQQRQQSSGKGERLRASGVGGEGECRAEDRKELCSLERGTLTMAVKLFGGHPTTAYLAPRRTFSKLHYRSSSRLVRDLSGSWC